MSGASDGPWRVYNVRSGSVDEYGDDLYPELTVRGPKLNPDDNPYHQVADCGDPDNDRAVANAHLIAAAPELLAACERLADVSVRLAARGPVEISEICELAGAAVAKAKGGAE